MLGPNNERPNGLSLALVARGKSRAQSRQGAAGDHSSGRLQCTHMGAHRTDCGEFARRGNSLGAGPCELKHQNLARGDAQVERDVL